MNTLPPVANLTFEYQSYDATLTGLFVRMTVKDTTAGSGGEVLVGHYPMLHVGGGQYLGYFTPVVNKQYSIRKAVYTDGTYTTEDFDKPCGSESFICKDLSTGGGGGGGTSSENDSIFGVIDDDESIFAVVDDPVEIAIIMEGCP